MCENKVNISITHWLLEVVKAQIAKLYEVPKSF